MSITAWRIHKAKYIDSAFDGLGSRKAGGRWNSVGTCTVYTSESLALATLEASVHLPSYKLLKGYHCISITFDESFVTRPADIPKGWDVTPPVALSQRIGDRWIRNRDSAVLQVPSTIIPCESNFLVNPFHEDFSRMVIGEPLAYPYDARLHKEA